MRDQLRRGHDDGVVAVLVAIFMVFMIGLLAFAVDVGNAYATKRKLSTAADGAALAAAQELAFSDASCTDASTASAARDVAEAYNLANADDGDGAYVPLSPSDVVLSCSDADGGTVRVTNREAVDFVFGGVLGVDDVLTPGAATAQYGLPGSLSGLRPFGLCDKSSEFLALRSSASTADFSARPTVRLPFEKTKDGDCGPAPGNWGVIDFDGGSNPTGDVQNWIEFGYDEEVDLGPLSVLSGEPGNLGGGAFESQLDAIVGETILLPVYTAAVKSGDNADFTITEFISVRFCGWRTSNTKSNLPDNIDPDGCSLTEEGDKGVNYLEMRFDKAIAVGDLCTVPLLCAGSTGIKVIALVE